MALARIDHNTKGRVPTGFADEVVISDATFRARRREYEVNPEPPAKKQKREGKGDASIVYGAGAYKGPWASFSERRPDALADESGDEEEVEVEDGDYIENALPTQPTAPKSLLGTAYEETGDGKESSEFLGHEQYDYQGRTYMHIPQDLDVKFREEGQKNFVPKRLMQTWKGHSKAITQTRFFPGSGHLLLSASADTKVLLWDIYHDRELLRRYSGHDRSVVDIDFAPDGADFITASFDRSMKLFDTETGDCKGRFGTGATPHVVRINPSQPHEFLAGMGDKKIVQFDTRVGDTTEPVQVYDHHLGPINTLTYCDEDRRFISTSDDKSLRAWEYGIPVPIKFIAEPDMYPLVRSSPHPSGKYVAYQSANNEIHVYSCSDKFRQNRKKGFHGHNNAGYAIDVAVSPSGDLVASGSSDGSVYFWDWKTCKLLQKLPASKDGAIVSAQWHPRETSKFVSGALDGTLKYWD